MHLFSSRLDYKCVHVDARILHVLTSCFGTTRDAVSHCWFRTVYSIQLLRQAAHSPLTWWRDHLSFRYVMRLCAKPEHSNVLSIHSSETHRCIICNIFKLAQRLKEIIATSKQKYNIIRTFYMFILRSDSEHWYFSNSTLLSIIPVNHEMKQSVHVCDI